MNLSFILVETGTGIGMEFKATMSSGSSKEIKKMIQFLVHDNSPQGRSLLTVTVTIHKVNG